MKITVKKRWTIGVVINDLEIRYQSIVWPAILEVAKNRDANIIIYAGEAPHSPNEYEYQHNIIFKMINKDCVDGIVVVSTVLSNYSTPEQFENFIQQFKDIPLVSIAVPLKDVATVMVDNKSGIIELVDHFVQKHNFKHIAFIKGPDSNHEAQMRLSAYKEGLKKNGIKFNPKIVTTGTFLSESGAEAVDYYYKKNNMKLDAIIASNDEMAIGAYKALIALGISVPEDVAIAGFDDLEEGRFNGVPLTTVAQPIRELSMCAIEKLLNRLEGKKDVCLNPLPTKLVIRNSCGCFSEVVSGINVERENENDGLKNESEYLKEVVNYICNILGVSGNISPALQKMLHVFVKEMHSYTTNQSVPDSSEFSLIHLNKCISAFEKEDIDVYLWHDVLSYLRRLFLKKIKDKNPLSRLETIIQKARVMVSEIMQRIEGYARITSVNESLVLSDVLKQLITSLNVDALMHTINEQIKRVNIPGIFICLYNDVIRHPRNEEISLPEYSEIKLICKNENRVEVAELETTQIETRKLLPDSFIHSRDRFDYLLMPLFFTEDQFGYVIFELGPHDGKYYDSLRVQISSALKGAILLESHLHYETELRIRRDNLGEQVKLRTKELEELKNYLANIINSMPSFIASVDMEGRINQWNVEAEKNTNLSFAQVENHSLADIVPELKNEIKILKEQSGDLKRTVRSRRSIDENGKEIFEEITLYPLKDGEKEGAVIRIDDVTKRIEMEEMMIQSEKMLSVGGLAAGMAHEINNPLAGMMQTAEVLLLRLGEDIAPNIQIAEELGITMSQIRSFMERRDVPIMLQRIRESGSRAAEIVYNMLTFARKGKSGKSTTSIPELMEKTLELANIDYNLKKQYDFKRIKIVKEYDENIPLVPCESTKIQQVLLNLFKNGAEAMHEDLSDDGQRPAFIIRIKNDPSNNMVRIEISDNGPGIPEHVRKRVFEPFFSTKPTNKGTGLGLSVSYFIITQNHNGEMFVKSTPGKGTTFVIKLPVEVDS